MLLLLGVGAEGARAANPNLPGETAVPAPSAAPSRTSGGAASGSPGGADTGAQPSVIAWGDDSFHYGVLAIPAGLADVTAVAAGPFYGLALKRDGTVAAWGAWGDSGESKVFVPNDLSHVTAIAAGVDFSLALKDDGTVVSWGGPSCAQRANASPCSDMPALSGVVAIAAGNGFGLALKNDGTVVAWGLDWWGNTTDIPGDLSDVVAISAGDYYSLALKRDGTVETWGGAPGQQPTVPAGLSGVTAIAASGDRGLALKNDGTVVSWDPAPEPPEHPHLPVGLSGVVKISVGCDHYLALKSDGTVVSSDGSVPVGLSHVTEIAAGCSFSLALGTVIVPAEVVTGVVAASILAPILIPLFMFLLAFVIGRSERARGRQVDRSHEWRFVVSDQRYGDATVSQVFNKLHGPGAFERRITLATRWIKGIGLVAGVAVGPFLMLTQHVLADQPLKMAAISGLGVLLTLVTWFVAALVFDLDR